MQFNVNDDDVYYIRRCVKQQTYVVSVLNLIRRRPSAGKLGRRHYHGNC